MIKSTRKQPRRLWSELNRVMGRHTQSTVQHIQTDEGDLYDSQGRAMAFNEHFITQIQQMVDDTSASTSTSTGAYSSALSEPLNVPHFTFSPVNSSVVCNLSNCLDVCKAAGCDGIQARALQLAAPGVARSLCSLFNLSLETASIPLEWKSANVTHISHRFQSSQLLQRSWSELFLISFITSFNTTHC